MRKNIKNIDALVKKVIEESLQEKADELTKKVKTKMDEWTPNAPVTLSGVGVTEEDDEDSTDDYIMDKLKRECADDPMSEGCMRHKKYAGVGDELDEELIGGQKKLDKNKNGKLDKQDFKMLRGDVEEGFYDTNDYDYLDMYDSDYDNNEFDELEDYGEKDTAMSRMRRGKGDVKDIDFEEMDEQVFPGDFDDLDDEKEIDDYVIGPFGTPEKKDFRRGVDLGKPSFLGKLKNKLKFGKHEEEMDEEVEEGNAFTGALAKTKKGDKFNLGGKSYTDRSNLEEAEKFIQKVYEDIKRKKKTVKESLQLTESEMIDLIEKIVMEQKKAKGMAETEKVLSANKKENEDAIKAVTKKMKEYLKDGSKGEYNMEPKIFPKGNGELAKMDKMAYNSSEAVDEYIDAFAHPGQTNLVFDEIKPDDEKIKRYLKGDAKSGNSQKYANAVETEVGDKFYKNYEDNLYGAEQMNASYKRQPQPVDMAGETKGTGSLKSIRGKNSSKKAQKVIDKVDESKIKSEKLISEEFDKMKHLMGYNKNTQ